MWLKRDGLEGALCKPHAQKYTHTPIPLHTLFVRVPAGGGSEMGLWDTGGQPRERDGHAVTAAHQYSPRAGGRSRALRSVSGAVFNSGRGRLEPDMLHRASTGGSSACQPGLCILTGAPATSRQKVPEDSCQHSLVKHSSQTRMAKIPRTI